MCVNIDPTPHQTWWIWVKLASMNRLPSQHVNWGNKIKKIIQISESKRGHVWVSTASALICPFRVCVCSAGRRRTCAGLPKAPTWPPSTSGALLCGAGRSSSRSRGSATRECPSSTSPRVRGKHVHPPGGFIEPRVSLKKYIYRFSFFANVYYACLWTSIHGGPLRISCIYTFC